MGFFKKIIGMELVVSPESKQTEALTIAAKKVQEVVQFGGLEATHVIEAVAKGDRDFTAAALAYLSGYPETTAQAILSSTDARALTALIWKSKLPMRLSVQIQMGLMHVPHTGMVQANEQGDFALSPLEMDEALAAFGKNVAR